MGSWGTNWGARRAEQFHFGNYTLTPVNIYSPYTDSYLLNWTSMHTSPVAVSHRRPLLVFDTYQTLIIFDKREDH